MEGLTSSTENPYTCLPHDICTDAVTTETKFDDANVVVVTVDNMKSRKEISYVPITDVTSEEWIETVSNSPFPKIWSKSLWELITYKSRCSTSASIIDLIDSTPELVSINSADSSPKRR